MRIKVKLLAIVGLLIAPVLQAEGLTIPGHVETGQQQVLPRRGIDMNAVIIEFGQPDERYGPIGEPPITEWVYGGFRVYFEHDLVLHSIDLTTLIIPK